MNSESAQNLLHSHIFLSKNDKKPVSDDKLIILHGFLGMSDNWKTLATQYAEYGFETHVLDLRNHGKSFHSDEFTYEAMVQDLLHYCQVNQLQKINIIGHSMGGKLAMFFAQKYSEMVKKLVVADIAPRFYKPHHQEILSGLAAVNFQEKPTRAAVEEVLTRYIPDFGTRQFLLKSLFWQEPGQLAYRFNLKAFLQNTTSIGEEVPSNVSFKNPTLFIKGGNSNYIALTDEQNINTIFPNNKIVTIPNAGHWLHAENPKMFFDETVSFLS
jgi:esterase